MGTYAAQRARREDWFRLWGLVSQATASTSGLSNCHLTEPRTGAMIRRAAAGYIGELTGQQVSASSSKAGTSREKSRRPSMSHINYTAPVLSEEG